MCKYNKRMHLYNKYNVIMFQEVSESSFHPRTLNYNYKYGMFALIEYADKVFKIPMEQSIIQATFSMQ